MSERGGVMSYVNCHMCGDPVTGRIPSGDEARQLTCAHCHEKFDFADSEIKTAVVVFDDRLNRWKIPKLS